MWNPRRFVHSAPARFGPALAAFAFLGSFFTVMAVARAQPPENVAGDPQLAQWFQSLRQPGSGISCCSIADCRFTQYREDGDGYEAMIDDKWLPVPQDRVLQHISNPSGSAVVCYHASMGILCFVRPPET